MKGNQGLYLGAQGGAQGSISRAPIWGIPFTAQVQPQATLLGGRAWPRPQSQAAPRGPCLAWAPQGLPLAF